MGKAVGYYEDPSVHYLVIAEEVVSRDDYGDSTETNIYTFRSYAAAESRYNKIRNGKGIFACVDIVTIVKSTGRHRKCVFPDQMKEMITAHQVQQRLV